MGDAPLPGATPSPSSVSAAFSSSESRAVSPLRVAITGASGLVGSALAPALAARGHDVVALSRSAGRTSSNRIFASTYDPLDPSSVARALAGADAVVHLAGHNVFNGRWTAKNRERIRSSRVDTTRTLVAALKLLSAPSDGTPSPSTPRRPSALVCASAVGYYGPLAPEKTVDESAPPGADFLATVCTAWEAAAREAESLGVRTVITRFGVVLSREGGALREMARPFRWFLGGPVGNGKQVVSWIHVDDVVGILVAAIEDPRWRGAVNATAPFAVSNRELSRALGRALHRPSFLPAPKLALRVALGGVASLVTSGQRVLPGVARKQGYEFRYPTIADAFTDLFRA